MTIYEGIIIIIHTFATDFLLHLTCRIPGCSTKFPDWEDEKHVMGILTDRNGAVSVLQGGPSNVVEFKAQ